MWCLFSNIGFRLNCYLQSEINVYILSTLLENLQSPTQTTHHHHHQTVAGAAHSPPPPPPLLPPLLPSAPPAAAAFPAALLPNAASFLLHVSSFGWPGCFSALPQGWHVCAPSPLQTRSQSQTLSLCLCQSFRPCKTPPQALWHCLSFPSQPSQPSRASRAGHQRLETCHTLPSPKAPVRETLQHYGTLQQQ